MYYYYFFYYSFACDILFDQIIVGNINFNLDTIGENNSKLFLIICLFIIANCFYVIFLFILKLLRNASF